MKEETAGFLARAHECLHEAEGMLTYWPHHAGRTAYLAGLHAAQALIFEKAGKYVKSHKGVKSELGRLTRDESTFGPEQRAFLGTAYDLKAISDYETGPGSKVSLEMAAEALGSARRFVAVIAGLLNTPQPSN